MVKRRSVYPAHQSQETLIRALDGDITALLYQALKPYDGGALLKSCIQENVDMLPDVSEPAPYPQSLTETCNVRLNTGILAVEGPDAVKFLQGQLTCDLRELAEHQTRLGAQCNPKGRMLTSFRALQPHPETVWLLLPIDMLEPTRASLGKYIVFSKAKLTDVSATFICVGFQGPETATLLQAQLGHLPNTVNEWVQGDGFWVIKQAEDRYLCGFAQHAEAAFNELTSPTRALTENYWTLLDIRAGLGEVRFGSREIFTPQSLNFQLVNGISFRKGCYTGQEIVARLHYRGTLKRHMYRLGTQWPNNHPLPEPATRVVNAQGQSIGEVVMAAWSTPESIELLAHLSDDALDNAWLEMAPTESASGQGSPKKLDPLSLPYAIPKADEH